MVGPNLIGLELHYCCTEFKVGFFNIFHSESFPKVQHIMCLTEVVNISCFFFGGGKHNPLDRSLILGFVRLKVLFDVAYSIQIFFYIFLFNYFRIMESFCIS